MIHTISIKYVLAIAIRPLAILCNRFDRHWQQFWSFSKVSAQLQNVDQSVIILGNIDLHGTLRITLGRNLYLYRDLHLETRENGLIDIGNDVVISRGVHLVSYASIKIGEGSIIGEYTSIRDANHKYGSGVSPRYSGHIAKPIVIGKKVWIGRGVTILPGIFVGDGAVIGANAVVTEDVAAGTVVAGIPAKLIKKVDC